MYFLIIFFLQIWKFRMIKQALRFMSHCSVWICLFVKVIMLLHQIHENPDRGTDTLKNDNLAILYKDEKKVNTVVCVDSVL